MLILRLQMGILQLGQYDAFMLYAHSLLKCLDAGEDPRNATVLNNIMWNATFPGKIDGIYTHSIPFCTLYIPYHVLPTLKQKNMVYDWGISRIFSFENQ